MPFADLNSEIRKKSFYICILQTVRNSFANCYKLEYDTTVGLVPYFIYLQPFFGIASYLAKQN